MTINEWLSFSDGLRMLYWLTEGSRRALGRSVQYPVSDRKLLKLASVLGRHQHDPKDAGPRYWNALDNLADEVHDYIDPVELIHGLITRGVRSPLGAIPSEREGPWFREVLGIPMRPLPPSPESSLIRGLAEGAYQHRLDDGTLDHQRLLVLSDAMEEQGFTDPVMLWHLRGYDPIQLDDGLRAFDAYVPRTCEHYRGCWVVDWATGRE